MNEDEQKKFDDAIAAQETAEKALKEEKEGREADKTAHDKAITEKDAIITTKTNDLVNQRKSFKKISDMSAEEKEAMTAKEIEMQQRQEDLEKSQEDFKKEQADILKKGVTAKRDAAIKKFAGDDADLIKKITDNFERIKDSGDATTDEEINSIAKESFNMLGVPTPDAVTNAINLSGGGDAGEVAGTGFAESEKGKNLATSLGFTAPEAPKAE